MVVELKLSFFQNCDFLSILEKIQCKPISPGMVGVKIGKFRNMKDGCRKYI